MVGFSSHSQLISSSFQSSLQSRLRNLWLEMVKKGGLYVLYHVCSASMSFDFFASKWVHNTQVRLTWSAYWLPLPPSKIVKPKKFLVKVSFNVSIAQLGWWQFTLLKIAVPFRAMPCNAVPAHFCKACQPAQHGMAQHSRHLHLQNNQCHAMSFSADTLYFSSVNVVLEVGLCSELILFTYRCMCKCSANWIYSTKNWLEISFLQ